MHRFLIGNIKNVFEGPPPPVSIASIVVCTVLTVCGSAYKSYDMAAIAVKLNPVTRLLVWVV